MNIEDRRKREQNVIQLKIVDFFLQFYDIGYEYDKDIILKKTLNLYKSDISIRLSSFIDQTQVMIG
jgi:hypothetical protein